MAERLVMFGFAWMVVAALVGLVLARLHHESLEQLETVAGRGDLLEYHRISDAYKWNKTVHAHAFLFSLVAVSVGLAMPRMVYPLLVIDALGVALMVAPVTWTIGARFSLRPLMVIGDLALLASIAVAAAGMARSL